jgi:hypothetical protein
MEFLGPLGVICLTGPLDWEYTQDVLVGYGSVPHPSLTTCLSLFADTPLHQLARRLRQGEELPRQ